MSAIVSEWLNLLLRWFHILAGISWIGSSFYFMWLDSHLSKPSKPKENVTGELWMVHSGGFYQVEKRLITAGQMPEVLHWFKWEAFFTWLSGICLLMVVYYFGGGIYLVDQSVSSITVNEARAIGIGLLIVSWTIYDFIWASPLGQKLSQIATLICLILTCGVIYELSHLFSGRAAFIHVGAMFGTIMVANVWMRILPGQRRMIEATERGEKPDYSEGARAKTRSVHNNYMTFPVIFVMISNHFPSTYGNKLNWVILIGLFLASALVRHMMNKGTVKTRWLLLPAAAIIAALFVMTSPHISEKSPDPTAQAGSFTFVDPANSGSLRGIAHYKGKIPQGEVIHFPAGCAEQHGGPVYQSSVIANEGGLKNVFVTITQGLEGKIFAPPGEDINFDQKGCMYEPLVLGAQVGQKINFLNSDPVFHNVRALAEKNTVFNEGMQNKDTKLTKVFDAPEIMVHIHCDVHPWMNAYVGVTTHPFFAITDKSGHFEIKNIPPGNYTLTAWHETLGVQTAQVKITLHENTKLNFNFEASK